MRFRAVWVKNGDQRVRRKELERRALQLTMLLAGLVPVVGGGGGAVRGAVLVGAWPGPAADSHFRYLSGLLLGIGLLFWGCIPGVEKRGPILRGLTFVVMVGGLARLAGWGLGHDPQTMRWTLIMELGVTPAICLWQARVAWLDKLAAPD